MQAQYEIDGKTVVVDLSDEHPPAQIVTSHRACPKRPARLVTLAYHHTDERGVAIYEVAVIE